jgi:hypothetical protein
VSAGLTRLIRSLALMTLIKNLGRHTSDRGGAAARPVAGERRRNTTDGTGGWRRDEWVIGVRRCGREDKAEVGSASKVGWNACCKARGGVRFFFNRRMSYVEHYRYVYILQPLENLHQKSFSILYFFFHPLIYTETPMTTTIHARIYTCGEVSFVKFLFLSSLFVKLLDANFSCFVKIRWMLNWFANLLELRRNGPHQRRINHMLWIQRISVRVF